MLSKMAAPNDKFFASLERNFIGIRCTMEAETMVSNSTQCGLFIGKYKKYTPSGVTFSFKFHSDCWLEMFLSGSTSERQKESSKREEHYRNCTCVDQSKQVTVLCLDHLSSKNSRLNDILPEACVSL